MLNYRMRGELLTKETVFIKTKYIINRRNCLFAYVLIEGGGVRPQEHQGQRLYQVAYKSKQFNRIRIAVATPGSSTDIFLVPRQQL